MNIFFLDKTPELSAKYLCDKHVPKMVLETAQMLSTAYRSLYGEDRYTKDLYKIAYPNHPMTKWVSEHSKNFDWTLLLGCKISNEYKFRFGKYHKSEEIIETLCFAVEDNSFTGYGMEGDMTTPPQCMPDKYKNKNYVIAYRNYYMGDKKYIAKWNKGRKQPKWWVN